ncbi:hypothetical protein M422DRAFT_68775 [Sphaerobolus stellatus SS14]|uniref:Unplaced genomic scaffold SPHSTscaffold_77, whole genome shotgun sequence n=1 Tax=Sphaerobolus stellatus (strain SS14) TaxID=990650 RepID=A0A0C9VN72_SPHS4|nr:hypothetical protein M422DRAFT_68775 [Sphaerobolus stellatus SS14]
MVKDWQKEAASAIYNAQDARHSLLIGQIWEQMLYRNDNRYDGFTQGQRIGLKNLDLRFQVRGNAGPAEILKELKGFLPQINLWMLRRFTHVLARYRNRRAPDSSNVWRSFEEMLPLWEVQFTCTEAGWTLTDEAVELEDSFYL